MIGNGEEESGRVLRWKIRAEEGPASRIYRLQTGKATF